MPTVKISGGLPAEVLMFRIYAVLIGYALGNILTAEIVVKIKTGKSSAEYGTGNPGMANVMHVFGFKAGIIVLAGDLMKTLTACLIAYFLLGGAAERIIVLYAGLGTTLGHNYPVWKRFRGGKGVATTCNALFLYSVPFGLISSIAGLITVLLTKYLCIGAVAIPLFFCIPAFLIYGTEAGILSVIFTVLMFTAHSPAIFDIRSGRTPKTDLFAKLKHQS